MKEKKKVGGWSTKLMEEITGKREFEETEEMVQWRSINQGEVENLWKELREKWREEVLEKFDGARKNAYKLRGETLEWRIVQREKGYQPRKCCEDCWATVYSWLMDYSLSRSKRMQEAGNTDEEERKQEQRMKTGTDRTRKIKAKGRMDANNGWWVSELLAADCKKAWLNPESENTMQHGYSWLHKTKKKGEEKRKEEEHQKWVSRMFVSAE